MTDPHARPDLGADAAPAGDDPLAPEAAQDPAAKAAQEAAEMKDRWIRAVAEMDNLRKRTDREVTDARLYGVSAFARDILTVADNMARALGALDAELREKADAALKGLLDGVELTERELLKVLDKHGVKRFEPQGEKFDPNMHQAMLEMLDPKVPPGHVAQVLQAGYKIGDRVLRPAMVAISKAPPKPSASDARDDEHANDNAG